MSRIVNLANGGEVANLYVLGDEGEAAIVFDFGEDKNHRVENYVSRHHPFLAGIFLTHGHIDHIGGLNDLKVGEGLKVILHPEDEPFLHDPHLNVSDMMEDDPLFGLNFTLNQKLPLYLCEDEDEILIGARSFKNPSGEEKTVGGYLVRVIHTPFHTGGSVCYYLPEEKALFSGDTLFHLGIGRSDLPGAKPRMMRDCLRKLLDLPDDVRVYPGHGPATTMEREKRFNPYLSGLK